MSKRLITVFSGTFIFVLALAGGSSVQNAMAQAPTKSVLDGVYSAAQAMRGEEEYLANCSGCHDDSAADVISIRGTQFIDRWREQSMGPLFTFMRTNMPKDAPGELMPNVYLDIFSFLLKVNGFKEGPTDLTAAAIPDILFVGPGGPKPLPNAALVIAVGCLAPGTGGNWNLTNVGDLVRTRVNDATNPEELKASQARALGTETLELRNIQGVEKFDPNAHKGHKLQIKGNYTKQTAGARVNVGSAEMLAATCP